MRTYETIFIVHPDVVGDDQVAIVDKYKQILVDQGSEVLNVDVWGTRTLAYTVKKQTKGCYVLVVFDAEPTVITEFERRMRIDEMVIKFQTVHLEKGYEAPPVIEKTEEADVAESTESTEEATEKAPEQTTEKASEQA